MVTHLVADANADAQCKRTLRACSHKVIAIAKAITTSQFAIANMGIK